MTDRIHVSAGLSQVTEMGLQVFHAGTALKAGGEVVTSGGRVLTVTAVRPTLESALHSANQGVASVGFPNAVYRRDIGHRAIAYLTRTRCVWGDDNYTPYIWISIAVFTRIY